MLSFSVIICYSAIEIDLYSLYRKKVISAVQTDHELKTVRSRFRFREKNDDLSLANQAVSKKPPFFVLF